MKINKDELKKKFQENHLRIGALCGALAGVLGMVAAEYYRREYNSLLARDLDDDWTSIDVPKEAVESMRNGAVMKIRQKTNGRNTKTQITMGDDWSPEADASFNEFS